MHDTRHPSPVAETDAPPNASRARLAEQSLAHAQLDDEGIEQAVCVVALVFPGGAAGSASASSSPSPLGHLVEFAVDGRSGARQMLRERIIEHCLEPARFDMDPAELGAAANDYAECLIEHMLLAAWRALRSGADAWCLPLGGHCIVALAPLGCISRMGESRIARLAHEDVLLKARAAGCPYNAQALKNYQQKRVSAN